MPSDLAPVLAEEANGFQEALVFLVRPIALATSALMLDLGSGKGVRVGGD